MYTCSCAAGYNGENCETSKFSVVIYNLKRYLKVNDDMKINFISTNKASRIKAQWINCVQSIVDYYRESTEIG